jgi:cold shock CspA family protein
MGQETMGKKEREQKKKKKAKEKAERKSEREANNSKGKSLDDMMVYLDENGNFSNTPPDPNKKKKEVDLENIQLGAAKREPENPEDRIKNGVVSFFNDAKGYGFITDTATRQNIFVHANELSEPIKDRDKVTFEMGNGPKGPIAQKVKKVK